jgi:23S rRNA (cytosine1962-C5)-methyltransferase
MGGKIVPSLILKPGREKSLLRRHPWIFSGAIQKADGDIAPGETVDILSSDERFLARAAFSPVSQIRARVWTFEQEPVDAEFLRKRIHTAIQSRDTWGLRRNTDAYRLIYAESDNLPGLIVDRYGDVLVFQSLTAGSEAWKDTSPTSCSKRPVFSPSMSDPMRMSAGSKGWSRRLEFCAAANLWCLLRSTNII